MPRPGDFVAGRYRIDQVIGVGGMGCVLAAEHLLLRTRVAIKLLLPQAAAWPGATERFLREAQAAATLRGEHVARVIDMGTVESGAPFMVMEFLQGRDLQKVIQERAPLSVHEAVDYLLQTCEAIHEAHSLGILHRDIKPANIFVTTRPNGTPLVKVLDFGLAKVRASADSATPEASITQTGQIIGSPHYMPPEQFRGLRHADVRSDIWALGVVLYELLAGKRPFTGEGTGGVMASIFSDEPVPLGSSRPDVPPPLDDLVMSCLSKKPERRPQQVAVLLAALEPYGPRAERASQAWIDPAPTDSHSRSAGVSFGALPPPSNATVRIAVTPPPFSPGIGAASSPAPSAEPVAKRLTPAAALDPSVGVTPSFAQTPAHSLAPRDVVALDNGAFPSVATPAPATQSAPAFTSATSGVSTSAYMGVATPVTPTGAQPSVSHSTESSADLSGTPPLAASRGASTSGAAGRLAWILGASVAGIVAVVGIVVRVVVSGSPNAGGAPSAPVATASLADAPPAVTVVPAVPATPQSSPVLAATVPDPAAPSTSPNEDVPPSRSSSVALPLLPPSAVPSSSSNAVSIAGPKGAPSSPAQKGAKGPQSPGKPPARGDILDRP